jgi:hypothetical protein
MFCCQPTRRCRAGINATLDSRKPRFVNPPSSCPDASLKGCHGGCVNLLTSVRNCGRCGHHCHAGKTCLNGKCALCNGGALAYAGSDNAGDGITFSIINNGTSTIVINSFDQVGHRSVGVQSATVSAPCRRACLTVRTPDLLMTY